MFEIIISYDDAIWNEMGPKSNMTGVSTRGRKETEENTGGNAYRERQRLECYVYQLRDSKD